MLGFVIPPLQSDQVGEKGALDLFGMFKAISIRKLFTEDSGRLFIPRRHPLLAFQL